jgi:hypothetical protein
MVARLVDRALKKYPLSTSSFNSSTTIMIQLSVVTSNDTPCKVIRIDKFIDELADSFNIKYKGQKSSLFYNRVLKFGNFAS